ncbi:MAG: ABC transporter permease [Clostridiaceae bacterium]|mgnify:CR=1 FL=1|nr:ABC transporter permease [Clostridiaceae bacterium]
MKTGKKLKPRRRLTSDQRQYIIVVVVAVLIYAFFSIKSPYFLRWRNIVAILVAAAPLGLVTIAECSLLTCGEWDMSCGNVASVAGIVWGLLTISGMNVWLALAIALCVGVVSGSIIGLLVSYCNMTAWMASYGVLMILQTFIYVLTDGLAFSMSKYSDFKILGQLKLFGTDLTLPILIMAVLFVAMFFVMKFTRFGRAMFMVGGNREAAINAGINVPLIKITNFILSGVLSALAGCMFVSRSGAVQPFVGGQWAMQAIASSIVGGCSLGGGKSNLGMAFVGVLIMSGLSNGLNMIGVSPFYQYMVTGLALFIAVLIQSERRK